MKKNKKRQDVEKYKFDKKFQEKLLTILIVDGAQLAINKLVKAEYFENIYHSQIAEVVLKLYKNYGLPLTFNTVKQSIKQFVKDDDEQATLFKILKKLKQNIKEVEQKLIVDLATRFARHQIIKKTMQLSLALLQKDDIEELEKQWYNALTIGSKKKNITQNYFRDFESRNRRRGEVAEILPTFIPAIDERLNGGGFNRKELSVFLSVSSAGKSFALAHMAKAAVHCRKKVVIYTLEMSADKYAGRLDASWSGVTINDLHKRSNKVRKKIAKIRKQYGDAILIREFSAKSIDVNDIRSDLIALRAQGFEPEVVIVDYINLFFRGDPKKDSYRALGDVYIDLRGVAQDFNVWMVTAAQANKVAFKADIAKMDNLAESFEGSMHSDVIISINRNEAERRNFQARLYLAKNRNDVDNFTVKINTDYARGIFYSSEAKRKAA